jgi:hypothetical protein
VGTAVTEHRGTDAFLGIMPVTLVGPSGTRVDTCALLDNGSTRSFIDEGLAETLSLKGKNLSYAVTTLTASQIPCRGKEADLELITRDLALESTHELAKMFVFMVPPLIWKCEYISHALHGHIGGITVIYCRIFICFDQAKIIQTMISSSSGMYFFAGFCYILIIIIISVPCWHSPL